MDAHEHVLRALDLAADEREVRLAAQALAVGDRCEVAVRRRQSYLCDALDELLVPPPVLDQVGDREQLDLVPLAERDEVGTRAIVPSSFMISQTTPAAFRPASRARSTAASVWPERSRTPPGRARSGNTWPGVARSGRPFDASIATWIVCERSCRDPGRDAFLRLDRDRERGAEGVSFSFAICSRASSSHRSGSGRGRSGRAPPSP